MKHTVCEYFGYEGCLLFTKRYAVYPERVYGEIAGITISIWYYKGEMCELEPIGPLERMEPGASFSFAEEWSLQSWRFPEPGERVDLAGLARRVGVCAVSA